MKPICRKCGSDLGRQESPRQRAVKWIAYLLLALLWTSLMVIDLDQLLQDLIRV